MDSQHTDQSCLINDTPFGYTLSLICGKYKMSILYLLSHEACIRFNEFKRRLGSITYKTLSCQLKELESDGLVERKEYPQIPPKVEYRLTELGQSLIPILNALCYWGYEHRPNGAQRTED